MYSLGNLTVKTGIRWRPAYVYLKDTETDDFKKIDGDEGGVNGTLMRQITGYQPGEIAEAGGCTGGFSIQTNFEFKINSGSCNKVVGYSDSEKEL